MRRAPRITGEKPATHGSRLTGVESGVLGVTIIADYSAFFIRSPTKSRLVTIVALDGLAIRTEVSILLAIVGGNAVDKQPATKRSVTIAINAPISFHYHAATLPSREASSAYSLKVLSASNHESRSTPKPKGGNLSDSSSLSDT
jgi:hypothetical protein